MEELRNKAKVHQPVYVFNIPEAFRSSESSPYSIGIVELNAKQLARARSRCRTDMSKLNDETIKESIVEINGIPVSATRDEVETFWDTALQKMIFFVTGAYQKVNSPSDEDFGESLETFTVKA